MNPNYLDFEQPIADLEVKIEELQSVGNSADLNIADDIINIYTVNDDPNSPLVDTVADAGGGLLMEILIKDIRYERCTIDGKEFGGLASTGFSLIETGTNTGIFEGTFKMPTEFCNKTGTKLITTAGGSIDAKYHDFRDSSGNPNIFSFGSNSNEFLLYFSCF